MSSKGQIKRLVDSVLSPFDLTLARRQEVDRTTLPGVFAQLKRCGFEPATVIDVGAAFGLWSMACYRCFSEARFILIEPLEEYSPFLESHSREIGGTYIQAAAGSRSGTQEINVHPDLVGSSFFSEEEGSRADGIPRSVNVFKLDEVLGDLDASAPFLMKLDVQGSELEVLEGASATLGLVEVIFIEVSFFNFLENTPTVAEIIAYMTERGFMPYDLLGLHHRPLDGALAQVDVVFVHHQSNLRRFHSYATAEQRDQQTRSARKTRAKYLRRLAKNQPL